MRMQVLECVVGMVLQMNSQLKMRLIQPRPASGHPQIIRYFGMAMQMIHSIKVNHVDERREFSECALDSLVSLVVVVVVRSITPKRCGQETTGRFKIGRGHQRIDIGPVYHFVFCDRFIIVIIVIIVNIIIKLLLPSLLLPLKEETYGILKVHLYQRLSKVPESGERQPVLDECGFLWCPPLLAFQRLTRRTRIKS